MQQAMKVQQQYAGLVARGDELFTGLRGEDEPGLATFEEDEPVPSSGYRESAFDRAADSASTLDETLSDAEVEQLPDDPAADAVTALVDELAEQVETGRQSVEELVEEVPGTEEILDEIAIDELVDQAATDDGSSAAPEPAAAPEPSDEAATAVDEGGTPVAAATGVRTDVGQTDTSADSSAIAAGAAVDAVGAESAAPTDDPEGASDLSGSQAAGTAPIDGYDGFSVAQLRGRLRGYQLNTVQDLVDYEERTRARQPYLRMLRNRLEKLEQQAVESSPLAPRG
jgi:hypothetical protein